MISYQVIKQGETELHLNSDYLRLVYPDPPRGDGPIVIVEGFVAGGDSPLPLTAINEYNFSIVKDKINSPGNYLFSIAGFPVVKIGVFSGEINSMDRSSGPFLPEDYYDIKVSWEEK